MSSIVFTASHLGVKRDQPNNWRRSINNKVTSITLSLSISTVSENPNVLDGSGRMLRWSTGRRQVRVIFSIDLVATTVLIGTYIIFIATEGHSYPSLLLLILLISMRRPGYTWSYFTSTYWAPADEQQKLLAILLFLCREMDNNHVIYLVR